MSTFSLASHTALVTGSSQGIGLALAEGIQAAGATVVLHGKAGPAPAFPAPAAFIIEDLLAPDGPARTLARAFEAEPGLDLLVCNAGGFFDRPFLDMTPELFDRTLQLNARANYFLAQAFARELIARKRPGAIVTTCSTNGFQSEEDSTAYDTSKGALVMMTRTLAQALAPHSIRVNGIAPGLIRTPMSMSLMDPAKVAHYEKKIIQGRLGAPEDCAGATVFLLSSASAYITGQVITIDGGLTLGQIGRI